MSTMHSLAWITQMSLQALQTGPNVTSVLPAILTLFLDHTSCPSLLTYATNVMSTNANQITHLKGRVVEIENSVTTAAMTHSPPHPQQQPVCLLKDARCPVLHATGHDTPNFTPKAHKPLRKGSPTIRRSRRQLPTTCQNGK